MQFNTILKTIVSIYDRIKLVFIAHFGGNNGYAKLATWRIHGVYQYKYNI